MAFTSTRKEAKHFIQKFDVDQNECAVLGVQHDLQVNREKSIFVFRLFDILVCVFFALSRGFSESQSIQDKLTS